MWAPRWPNFGFRILDFGSWILDFGSWILDFGFRSLDFGFRILDLGFWILDFGIWILDFGGFCSNSFLCKFWILDFEFLISDFGFAFGYTFFGPYIVEGSLNSKLPTIWRVEKQMKSRWDEIKSEERRCNCAKVRREESPAPNVREVAKCCVFQWFVCPVSRKVGSLKRHFMDSLGRIIMDQVLVTSHIRWQSSRLLLPR